MTNKTNRIEISVLIDKNHPGYADTRYQESYLITDADHLAAILKTQISKGCEVRGTLRVTEIAKPSKEVA
tara:strand:+ start:758 stop:967 length:210 start_codon:yes stop_codon:yes gene_type:complete